MGRIEGTHEEPEEALSVFFVRAAAKEFEALPATVKKAVNEWIERLRKEPIVGEPLSGELKGVRRIAFRVKGTEYRIAYEVLRGERKALIYMVGKREGFYERLQRRIR